MQYSDMVATAAFAVAVGIPAAQGIASWVRRSLLYIDVTVQPITRVVIRPGVRSYNGGLDQRLIVSLIAPDRGMRVRLSVEVEDVATGVQVEGLPARGRVALRRDSSHKLDVHVRVGEHSGMDRERRVRVRATRAMLRPVWSEWVHVPRDMRERVLDEDTLEYREVEPDGGMAWRDGP